MKTDYDQLKHIVQQSKHLVAFTGAGLSAASGIPTYRGAGGLWTKYDPAKYASIDFFHQNPSYYWKFFRDIRYPLIKKAQPNRLHKWLVHLEKKKKIDVVITQNIDGLHQLAGQQNIIELHGNTRRIVCSSCENEISFDDAYRQVQTELPPRCFCGDVFRPKTVMFGESLPTDALKQAQDAARECDLFLVLGSSLVVYPAAYLPLLAKNHHAKVVIINIDPTPLDKIADAVYSLPMESIIPKVM